MRKLQVFAATVIVFLGLIGFGNPALAETYIGDFSNLSNHTIFLQSDNAGDEPNAYICIHNSSSRCFSSH